MLFLLFQLGNDRYAIDTDRVVEILPLMAMKDIPRSPPEVAGTINYRGTPVPIIDLSQLALGRSARAHLSTRIVVVRYKDRRGDDRIIGLIAEHATETVRYHSDAFVTSGVSPSAAPYLGPVVVDPRGMVQRVEVEALLPQSVQDLLFTQATAV